MNKKRTAIAIAIIIIIVVSITAYLFLQQPQPNPNPPIPLQYRGQIYDALNQGYINGTFYAYVGDNETTWRYFDGTKFAYKPDSEMPHQYVLNLTFYTTGVLYNCKANVTYLATNGTWIKITKELGIVDVNVHNLGVEFPMSDYKTEPNVNFTLAKAFLYNYQPFEFDETVTLSTVKIEAYGYSKP
jgi:hypothetical protein